MGDPFLLPYHSSSGNQCGWNHGWSLLVYSVSVVDTVCVRRTTSVHVDRCHYVYSAVLKTTRTTCSQFTG